MQFTAKQLGLIFGIILLVVLLLLGTSPTGKRMSAGFIRPFAETKKYVSDQTSTLFAGNTQKEQIARLETRLRELELNERSVTELKQENSQLRQMLSMRPFPVWNIIRAEVLTRDPVFWDSRFTIDRGEADGIASGSAVLFGDAMIGRIGEVSRHSAVVDTIVSRKCRIGVTLGEGRGNGLMQGMGWRDRDVTPGCIVDFLPLSAVAEENDLLITSGLGGTIPGGIPLAVVRPDHDGASIHEVDHARKRLYAAPRDNWDDIRFVSVIVQK